MKYRYYILISILFFISGISAQTSISVPVELKWKGIERWYADTSYSEILSFEGAEYSDDRLPYFHHQIPAEEMISYKAELKNIEYVPVEGQEIPFLQGTSLTEFPDIKTYISNSRGEKLFHIQVSVFVKQHDQVFKVKSFDINIIKTPQAQRVASASTKHTYANESVLSKGRFVKVQISESGIYKLTYDELRGKGLEPSNIRMFGYGGAVLDEDFTKQKHDDLPEIAVYDNGTDAILFYAQGINKWTYNSSKSMFIHTSNPYSSYGYYFVTSDNIGEKKRIPLSEPLTPSVINDVTQFTDYKLHEKDLISIIKSGKEFYGERFTPAASMDFSFEFPNIIETSTAKVRLDVAASSSKNNFSTFSLKLDNSSQNLIVFGKIDDYDSGMSASKEFTFTTQSDVLNFNLSYKNSEQSALGYLNFIEVNARRKLKMIGTFMTFHNRDNVGSNSFNRYLLETDNTNIQIWNITDLLNIRQIPAISENDKLVFIDSSEQVKSYVAIDATDLTNIPSATLLSDVPHQNIHAMDDIDMLIITHPLFISPAKKLAGVHNERGLKVEVITSEEIYNEFSSGTPDATAYRWAAKMFYDRAVNPENRIKNLLLIGKGSFDNRGLFQDSGDKFLLTYQSANSLNRTASYVTDDYFGLMDDSEGTNLGAASNALDIAIGRFPVTTEADAYGMVDKTIGYLSNENKGAWRNELCFLGDDGDKNDHMTQADLLAVSVANIQPGYHINKILFDAYQQEITGSGESYPVAKKHFLDLVESGVLFINYMGHGTAISLASEKILQSEDIKKMQNKNLPFFSAGTCEFSRFDREMLTGGEELIKNPAGGAIGVFAAARTVYANHNCTLIKSISEHLFSKPYKERITIGEAILNAKNATTGDRGNKLSYVYFGDPSVTLSYPTQNNVHLTELSNNTLEALSVVTIKGIITDDAGNVNENFNGYLQITLFDKEQKIQTLANDVNSTPFEYNDRPEAVFKGKTSVKNGEYEFTFMVPKDIRYNYGNGRFVFYGWDTTNDYEAQGYYEDFVIGGINDDFINEYEGPEVRMYLNNENFISGGKVNEAPVFKADLFDINGINVTGSTPGHDIMLSVDNEQWYVLNDYYEPEENSYQKGTIQFQMSQISEGKHTLTLKVWDLINNSTTKTLDFEVVKGLDPEYFSINTYPNPASSASYIQINYNQHDEIENVTVDIFDLSGRKIWSCTQNSLETVRWNLNKINGENIDSGIYIYRVNIETTDKSIHTKSDKIIVTKQ